MQHLLHAPLRSASDTWLRQLRWLWQQLRDTANPHTTHTEELTSEARARQASYESFDYYTAYPDIYLRYLRQRHARTTPTQRPSTTTTTRHEQGQQTQADEATTASLWSHARLVGDTRDGGAGERLIAREQASNNNSSSSRAAPLPDSRNDDDEAQQHALLRWSLYVLIAVVVALVAATVTLLVGALEHYRVHTLARLLTGCRLRLLGYLAGYLFYLASSLLLVAVAASVVVLLEPAAAGGGIPDVMAYLNGVYVRRAMHLRTFVVKCVSCVCAVAGGLPVGLEAPLIHLGAIAAAGVTQGRSRTLRLRTRLFHAFRNNHDRRGFIMAGAACGVSAAFGAPIGGLLFVMEELASFWDAATCGQLFLACMACFTTVRILGYVAQERHWFAWWAREDGGDGGGGGADAVALLFEVNLTIPLHLVSIVPALVLGAALGALAALFTKANLLLLRWRRLHVRPHTSRRLLEPLLVAAVYSTVLYVLTLLGQCRALVPVADVANDTIHVWGSEPASRLFNATCTQPQTYSPLGSLNMASGKLAVRHLFSRQTAGAYPAHCLALYALLYTTFACVASGLAVSGGLVVPCLVVGASVGRLFGVVLWYVVTQLVPAHVVRDVARGYYATDAWADPGVFALIGAAAFLAGTSRMTISVCVIMMELSSELHYLLPVMLATVMAKSVADWLCEPLYHHQLRLDCVPYLAANLPLRAFQQLTAADVMSRDVVTLRARERTTRVLRALRETTHHAFPVMEAVDDDDDSDGDDDKTRRAATAAVYSDSDDTYSNSSSDSDSDDDDDGGYSPRGSDSTLPPTPTPRVAAPSPHAACWPQPSPPPPSSSTSSSLSSWLLPPPPSSATSSSSSRRRQQQQQQQQQQTSRRRRRRVTYRFAGLVTREDLLVYFALLQRYTTTTRSNNNNTHNNNNNDAEHDDARVRAINAMTWPEWSAHKAALFLTSTTYERRHVCHATTTHSGSSSRNEDADATTRVAARWLPPLCDDDDDNDNNDDHHRAAAAALLCALPATIDLSHIVNRSPWVVPAFFNCQMAYHIFRTMGLRHLVVVDGDVVCGIITRQDLLVDALRRRLAELQRRLARDADGNNNNNNNDNNNKSSHGRARQTQHGHRRSAAPGKRRGPAARRHSGDNNGNTKRTAVHNNDNDDAVSATVMSSSSSSSLPYLFPCATHASTNEHNNDDNNDNNNGGAAATVAVHV